MIIPIQSLLFAMQIIRGARSLELIHKKKSVSIQALETIHKVNTILAFDTVT